MTLDRFRTYRDQGGTLRPLATQMGVSTATLSRIANGKQHPSSKVHAQLDSALERTPPRRRQDRRLSTRLDEAREIQLDRDPYWRFAEASYHFGHERGHLTPEQRDAALGELDELWMAWGERDEHGRPTRTSYPLSYYELAGCDDSVASRLRRFVQRRARKGFMRDFNAPSPRTHEFLAELKAARAPTIPTQLVLETFFRQVARAAQWARTVELATAQGAERAE